MDRGIGYSTDHVSVQVPGTGSMSYLGDVPLNSLASMSMLVLVFKLQPLQRETAACLKGQVCRAVSVVFCRESLPA